MITSINELDLNKNYTYADYLTWQFDEMVELIKGKILRMAPAPLRWHQKISQKINHKFYNLFEQHPCEIYVAPFDVRLLKSNNKNNDKIETVVQPDICIICDKEKLDKRGCIGSPDLIVEIISKSSKKRDYNDKYNLYEENGVREYWIVDPAGKAVDVFFLENEKYQLLANFDEDDIEIHSSVFPELKIKWEDIFSD